MKKNKYLFGLIGLVFGFLVAYFGAQSINNSEAAKNPASGAGSPSAANATSGAPSSTGAQQAGMASVRDAIAAAKSKPDDFEAQVNAARMFFQIGRNNEAVDYLKRANEINPKHAGVTATIGNIEFEKGDFGEAEKWYRRAIELAPNDAGLYVEVGASLIQRQPPDPDKAITEIGKALKIDAKNTHAMGHLVEAYLLKKDARQAEETVNLLKRTEPTNERISQLQGMVADLKAGKPVKLPKEGAPEH